MQPITGDTSYCSLLVQNDQRMVGDTKQGQTQEGIRRLKVNYYKEKEQQNCSAYSFLYMKYQRLKK